MNTGVIGWVWVAGQAVLLGALILLPGGESWSTPLIVRAIANVLFFGGVLLAVIAGTRLGSALTPTPVPTKAGSLATTGLYRYVRHPIYSGVLMIVAGMTLRSGNWMHVVVALATVLFFDRKAAWEEQQLKLRYPTYETYATATPRFFPLPGRRS